MVPSVEPPSTRTTSYPSDRSGRRTSRLRASLSVGRTIETRGCARFLPPRMPTPVKTSPSHPPTGGVAATDSTSRDSESPRPTGSFRRNKDLHRYLKLVVRVRWSVKRPSTKVAQVLEEQRGNKANKKDGSRQHHGVTEGRSQAGLHELRQYDCGSLGERRTLRPRKVGGDPGLHEHRDRRRADDSSHLAHRVVDAGSGARRLWRQVAVRARRQRSPDERAGDAQEQGGQEDLPGRGVGRHDARQPED